MQLTIPSKSKLTRLHIIVVYPNRNTECQDCQGYSTSYLCAHAVAASFKRGSLETYVKWLVANKRKTGVLNYSRAITFGLPAGKRQEGRTTAKKKTWQRNNQYDRPKKLLAIHAKYWGK